MQIRQAHTQDINQLLHIEKLSYDTPWPLEAFEQEIGDEERGLGLVAEDEGIIVGFLSGILVADEFHLHNVAVHPDYRERGIGRQLLIMGEEYCHHRNCRRILLEVRCDNDPARHLYQSLGYDSVGHRKDYYGPGQDAFLYTKRLVED